MPVVPPVEPDTALALALALVDASTLPMLLLDERLKVIAASSSFGSEFAIDPVRSRGLAFADLQGGAWARPQLVVMLKAIAAGYADAQGYEMDLERPNHSKQHLVVRASKLDYGPNQQVRLMISATDITALRTSDAALDELVRQRGVLLQEIQHRVANSLQIIASILLQSARKVQSQEARGYLKDAHQRVMSIAEVQRQLAQSATGDVVVRDYLSHLCASLAASMIEDHEKLSIRVDVDDSAVGPDVSVSLGLMVTELVINALKHAFVDRPTGRILVSYHANGEDWHLSVADDGVGMPRPGTFKPGLGTGIVEALAKNLEAQVSIGEAFAGTRVLVSHTAVVAVGPELRPFVA